MAWYIAALPATEPTSDRRSRRLGIVSLSFGIACLVPRDVRSGGRSRASTDRDWLSRAPAASLQIPNCLRGNQWKSVRAVIGCIGDRHPISGKVCCNVKRRPRGLRFYPLFATLYSPLTQPPRRVREQGVDEPRVRGEVAAQRLRSAVLARDFVEQPFE